MFLHALLKIRHFCKIGMFLSNRAIGLGDGAFVREDLNCVGEIFTRTLSTPVRRRAPFSAPGVDVACEGVALREGLAVVACEVGSGFGVDLAFGGTEGVEMIWLENAAKKMCLHKIYSVVTSGYSSVNCSSIRSRPHPVVAT
jgi:hypothetical protein